MTREVGGASKDIRGAFDALRQLIAKADTMVCATERLLKQFTWSGEDDDEAGGDGRRLEHLAHLLGAAKEALWAAVHAGHQIAIELAKHRDGHMTNRTPTGDVGPAAADRAPTGDVAPTAADSAPTGDVGPATTDLAEQLDALRIAVGEAALAAGRVKSVDSASWRGTDPLQVEQMTHLLGAVSKAATTAVAVAERFRAFVSRPAASQAGDAWSDQCRR